MSSASERLPLRADVPLTSGGQRTNFPGPRPVGQARRVAWRSAVTVVIWRRSAGRAGSAKAPTLRHKLGCMALATERQAAPGPVVSLPDHFNVADYLVDRHVREGRGGRTAILCGDQSVSYAQVAERSHRVGNGLRSLGVQ